MLNGLSDTKIVSLLQNNSLWCKRACREILGRKKDFIPLLIDILDRTMDDFESAVCDGNYHHIPAALLLSQMREPQTYPRLVQLISYNEDDVDYLWGDLLTEAYPQMMRDTYNGDISLLTGLIEARSVSSFARAMALGTYGMYYFDRHIGRDEITGFFRHLIYEVYAGRPNRDDEIVLSYVADVAREHQLNELIPDIKTVYSRNGIDEYLCGNYEEYVAEFSDPIYLAKDLHVDAIQELQKWKWFEEKESSDDDDDYDTDTKIGRNDPCPCGSGKKYKHCCLNKPPARGS
jgi:hypothetical protein